jgi:putative transposase
MAHYNIRVCKRSRAAGECKENVIFSGSKGGDMKEGILRLDVHPDRRDRRSLRLYGSDVWLPGAYFVTLVTQDRACLFGEVENGEMVLNERGRIVESCWRAIPEHFEHVELGVYVVMPNHLHGIVVILDRAVPLHASSSPDPSLPRGAAAGSLSAVVDSFKSAASLRLDQEHQLIGVWQRGFYDHILRNGVDLDRAWNWIRASPSCWHAEVEHA